MTLSARLWESSSFVVTPSFFNAGPIGASSVYPLTTRWFCCDGASFIAHDTLERRVKQRTAQLDAANQELETFSYSVSHDLRAPLRQIDGFSKILGDEYGPSLDPGAQRYLRLIREGAKNMGQLVDDLLKLAGIGRQELACKPADLNALLQSALRDLAPECEQRQIEWHIGQLPIVSCDTGLMKQVFANLLSNAIKYTRHCEVAIVEAVLKHKPDDEKPAGLLRRSEGSCRIRTAICPQTVRGIPTSPPG